MLGDRHPWFRQVLLDGLRIVGDLLTGLKRHPPRVAGWAVFVVGTTLITPMRAGGALLVVAGVTLGVVGGRRPHITRQGDAAALRLG